MAQIAVIPINDLSDPQEITAWLSDNPSAAIVSVIVVRNYIVYIFYQ